MSVAENQRTIFLRLLASLRPHWRRDAALPARIQALLARHREFGARDRRLYRELIFTTLRHLPLIEPLLDQDPDEAVRRVAWFAAEAVATRPFRAAFATGDPPVVDAAALLPGWFHSHCPELFTPHESAVQLQRAPLWLRLNTEQHETVLGEFSAAGWEWRGSTLMPTAVELRSEADVTKSKAWQDGLIEVQDLGSQLILESVGVPRGGQWLDACAGAGGKTLQLAALLGPEGHVVAHDIRAAALAELKVRAGRAGISDRIRIVHEIPTATYDGVLVDVPCSGSGTWRRAPHLKWVTTDVTIARAAELQSQLLDRFSAQVRPGGILVYATCSLSHRENEDVVSRFLKSHPEFSVHPPGRDFGLLAREVGQLVLPSRHNTDGFFVAGLRRSGTAS